MGNGALDFFNKWGESFEYTLRDLKFFTSHENEKLAIDLGSRFPLLSSLEIPDMYVEKRYDDADKLLGYHTPGRIYWPIYLQLRLWSIDIEMMPPGLGYLKVNNIFGPPIKSYAFTSDVWANLVRYKGLILKFFERLTTAQKVQLGNM